MLTKRDIILIAHIKQESEFLRENSSHISYDSFLANSILKRAFERSIEIIGEATKKLSPDFKANYPQIDWKAISGMRDILIHEYFGVDYQIVWDVATNKSVELLQFVNTLNEFKSNALLFR